MDLIYADQGGTWESVVTEYEKLDMSWGDKENDFELTADLDLGTGGYLFVPETEWGGVVDHRHYANTDRGTVLKYSGRTWHGIMSHSIVRPDPGQAYLTVSGDLNAVISSLIRRQGLGSIFEAPSEPCGVSVSNYRINRYVDLYSALRSLTASRGMRLDVRKGNGLCVLRAVPARAYVDDGVDDVHVYLKVDQYRTVVNHLVCLGKGDLQDRIVLDLYADARGNVSRTQTLFGADEMAEVYDYSGAEYEELEEKGTERLLGYQSKESVDLSLPDDVPYSIGDTVGATSTVMDLSVQEQVSQAVLTIDRNHVAVLKLEVSKPTTSASYQ